MRADKLADKLKQLEPSIELSEEQWCEIEVAIGITEPNAVFRERLAHHVRLAFALASSAPPSFGEAGGFQRAIVKKHLRRIRKHSEQLADTLSELAAQAGLGDKNADWALFHSTHLWGEFLHERYPELWGAILAEEQFPGMPDEWRADNPQHLNLNAQKLAICVASDLATASSLTMQSLGDSEGGAPKKFPGFDEFVCTLAILYREVTGNRPSVTWDNYSDSYSGLFVSFIDACRRAFIPSASPQTSDALGKAVQRALKMLPSALLKGQNLMD